MCVCVVFVGVILGGGENALKSPSGLIVTDVTFKFLH